MTEIPGVKKKLDPKQRRMLIALGVGAILALIVVLKSRGPGGGGGTSASTDPSLDPSSTAAGSTFADNGAAAGELNSTLSTVSGQLATVLDNQQSLTDVQPQVDYLTGVQDMPPSVAATPSSQLGGLTGISYANALPAALDNTAAAQRATAQQKAASLEQAKAKARAKLHAEHEQQAALKARVKARTAAGFHQTAARPVALGTPNNNAALEAAKAKARAQLHAEHAAAAANLEAAKARARAKLHTQHQAAARRR